MWHTVALVKPTMARTLFFNPRKNRTRFGCSSPDDDVSDPGVVDCRAGAERADHDRRFRAVVQAGPVHAGVRGRSSIIDSSTDETPQRALENGARVLRTPKRGLGRAYIDALPFIRGSVRRDGRCRLHIRLPTTGPFVEKYHAGNEFIMGSRGSRATSSRAPCRRCTATSARRSPPGFSTVCISSKFSDIHCGMRGVTLDALKRMDLQSQSWEYVSEMVLKSVHLELRTTEVPVPFLKDQEGRVSHHRRAGWFSPWQAGVDQSPCDVRVRRRLLRVQAGPDRARARPARRTTAQPRPNHDREDLRFPSTPSCSRYHRSHSSASCAPVGLRGQGLLRLHRTAHERRLLRWFSYTRASVAAGTMILVGVDRGHTAVCQVFSAMTQLPWRPWIFRSILPTGLLMLIVGGFFVYVFTLMVHAAAISTKRHPT